jgi:AbrB family looped-hinge helix DNA binding protein
MSLIKMDANGRVLLPLGIRYRLDLNEGDKFAIDYLGDGTIILKKVDVDLDLENASLDDIASETASYSSHGRHAALISAK